MQKMCLWIMNKCTSLWYYGGQNGYLLAVGAGKRKLLLIAGQAVVAVLLIHKATGAHWLLAVLTCEAVLMPTVAFVLHLFGA